MVKKYVQYILLEQKKIECNNNSKKFPPKNIKILPTLPAHGRVGRVTDCGVGGVGFKSPGSILEQNPVLYHEWSGMDGTHALYR